MKNNLIHEIRRRQDLDRIDRHSVPRGGSKPASRVICPACQGAKCQTCNGIGYISRTAPPTTPTSPDLSKRQVLDGSVEYYCEVHKRPTFPGYLNAADASDNIAGIVEVDTPATYLIGGTAYCRECYAREALRQFFSANHAQGIPAFQGLTGKPLITALIRAARRTQRAAASRTGGRMGTPIPSARQGNYLVVDMSARAQRANQADTDPPKKIARINGRFEYF
jgi:hypothetical protein